VIFAIVIAIEVPLWDRILPSETNVEDMLWLCLAVVMGVVITAAVELVFESGRAGDDVVIPISDRLSATERLVTGYANGAYIDAATKEQIMQFAVRGTSYYGVYCGARTIRFNIPSRWAVLPPSLEGWLISRSL
jgi:hypothetical protein